MLSLRIINRTDAIRVQFADPDTGDDEEENVRPGDTLYLDADENSPIRITKAGVAINEDKGA